MAPSESGNVPPTGCRRWLQLRHAAGVEVDRQGVLSRRSQDGHRSLPWFFANPWYEIPSGAMATLAASRLQAMGYQTNPKKALAFVLDSRAGLLATGKWGGHEVNGLMAGFRTEPAGQ